MEQCVITKPLFGKEAEIVLETDAFHAKDVADLVYDEALRLHNIFNFYDENSELSLLNRKRAAKVSSELLLVLKRALELAKLTNGAYDVTLGKQFLQRKNKETVTAISCSYQDVMIKGNAVTLTHPDVLIDLGSIAKGFIADKMADVAKRQGVLSGTIDARGDIMVFGNEQTLEVQHPRNPNNAIASITIKNCGVATSGDYHQYNKSFNESHILNAKNVVSVTVIAPTLMEADAFATVLFVTKDAEHKALLEKNKNVKALIITQNLTKKFYNGFEKVLA